VNKTIILLIAALVMATGTTGAGDDSASEKSFSRSEIGSIINLPQSDQREKGVKAILNATDFDTTWAFNAIIGGLQIEEDYLENSRTIPEGYVWISWWNVQNYVRDLALLGSNSRESLEQFGRTLSAEQRTWVTIAAGYQKDEMVHEKLRKIITESDNILQKAMAIEAISQYQDTSDVDLLFNAFIEEGNAFNWKGDGTSCIMGFSPVGETALLALKKLGYEYDPYSHELIRLKNAKGNN